MQQRLRLELAVPHPPPPSAPHLRGLESFLPTCFPAAAKKFLRQTRSCTGHALRNAYLLSASLQPLTNAQL